MNKHDTERNEQDRKPDRDPLERVWREYELTRAGIADYDGHLFRIRSWYIALTAILVGGYFGVNVEDGGGPQKLDPNVALFAMLWLSCVFWLLDALNKSLQMVHIYNSHCLEALIRSDEHALAYSGVRSFVPTISLRFHKKQKRHARPTVKNLTDESVWPFYLLPMAVAAAVIWGSSRASWCFAPLPSCPATFWDAAFATGGAAAPVSLFLFSRLWKARPPACRYAPLWCGKKYLKSKFVERLREELGRLPETDKDLGPQYLMLFKANFRVRGCWIVVDGLDRVSDVGYQSAREDYFGRSGGSLMVVTVAGFLFMPDDDRYWDVAGAICRALPDAPYLATPLATPTRRLNQWLRQMAGMKKL